MFWEISGALGSLGSRGYRTPGLRGDLSLFMPSSSAPPGGGKAFVEEHANRYEGGGGAQPLIGNVSEGPDSKKKALSMITGCKCLAQKYRKDYELNL